MLLKKYLMVLITMQLYRIEAQRMVKKNHIKYRYGIKYHESSVDVHFTPKNLYRRYNTRV